MQYLHELSDASLAILQITKTMLHELDFHEGPFASLRYTSMVAILNHPAMADIAMSQDEIYDLLFQERLHRVTSLLPSEDHMVHYRAFVDTVKKSAEKFPVMIPAPRIKTVEFPQIPNTLDHVRRRLVAFGADHIEDEDDPGIRRIGFGLLSRHFLRIFGTYEIWTKYAGEIHFEVYGGIFFNDEIGVRFVSEDIFGAIHYVKAHLAIPDSLKFRADPAGGIRQVDNVFDIMAGVISYFR